MSDSIRLDKWLWQVRVFKTRSLAAARSEAGGIRVNGQPAKPARAVRVGDVVTVSANGKVRVLKVLALGERRGPATEAATLCQDLTEGDAAPLE